MSLKLTFPSSIKKFSVGYQLTFFLSNFLFLNLNFLMKEVICNFFTPSVAKQLRTEMLSS